MLITRKIEIDMGHRIPNHLSKCRNIHGHRYVIEASIEGTLDGTVGSSSQGMVKDFGDLKAAMMEVIHDVYDHALVLWVLDPLTKLIPQMETAVQGELAIQVVSFVPTAENLARHFFSLLSRHELSVASVVVWETPNCRAECRAEEEYATGWRSVE